MSGEEARAGAGGTPAAERVRGSADGPTAELAAILPVAPVLVQDYRRLLRLFPYTYRRAHEAEMLGHLLDGSTPGQSRLPAAERWDLLRAATREWLLAPLGSTPRQRRAATGLLFVLLPAILVLMAARAVAFSAALIGVALTGDGTPSLLMIAPTGLMWALWLAAVALTLAGSRRAGLVVAWLAAGAGAVSIGVAVAVGHAYAAFLDVPWVAGIVACAGVLTARRTCHLGRESRRLRAATVWSMVLALGAYVAATSADAAHLGVPWWSGVALGSWTLQAVAVPVVVLLGAAVLWGRTRQAVPVLGGLAVAAVLSRSSFFWSGNLDPRTVDLGNVLALVAFAVVATVGARWVVNRLDELSEARTEHRALLAATGAGAEATA